MIVDQDTAAGIGLPDSTAGWGLVALEWADPDTGATCHGLAAVDPDYTRMLDEALARGMSLQASSAHFRYTRAGYPWEWVDPGNAAEWREVQHG